MQLLKHFFIFLLYRSISHCIVSGWHYSHIEHTLWMAGCQVYSFIFISQGQLVYARRSPTLYKDGRLQPHHAQHESQPFWCVVLVLFYLLDRLYR